MVDEPGFERLTAREREILRLVAQHRQSKEIARLLRISKSAVDKHVDKARERLGASSRREAALAFADWEARAPATESQYHPVTIADPDQPAASNSASREWGDAVAGAEYEHGQGDRAGAGLLPRDVASPGAGAGIAGSAEQGEQRQRDGVSPAPHPGGDTTVSAPAGDPFGDLLVDRREQPRWWLGGRRPHDLSTLQWLGLIVGIALVSAFILGALAMMAHGFLSALQSWANVIEPPPAG